MIIVNYWYGSLYRIEQLNIVPTHTWVPKLSEYQRYWTNGTQVNTYCVSIITCYQLLLPYTQVIGSSWQVLCTRPLLYSSCLKASSIMPLYSATVGQTTIAAIFWQPSTSLNPPPHAHTPTHTHTHTQHPHTRTPHTHTHSHTHPHTHRYWAIPALYRESGSNTKVQCSCSVSGCRLLAMATHQKTWSWIPSELCTAVCSYY